MRLLDDYLDESRGRETSSMVARSQGRTVNETEEVREEKQAKGAP